MARELRALVRLADTHLDGKSLFSPFTDTLASIQCWHNGSGQTSRTEITLYGKALPIVFDRSRVSNHARLAALAAGWERTIEALEAASARLPTAICPTVGLVVSLGPTGKPTAQRLFMAGADIRTRPGSPGLIDRRWASHGSILTRMAAIAGRTGAAEEYSWTIIKATATGRPPSTHGQTVLAATQTEALLRFVLHTAGEGAAEQLMTDADALEKAYAAYRFIRLTPACDHAAVASAVAAVRAGLGRGDTDTTAPTAGSPGRR